MPDVIDQPTGVSASAKGSARSGTFTDNMRLPVHRWFRYSAGFSADWVAEVVRRGDWPTDRLILDPFAGSGTVMLAAQSEGRASVGSEAHGFVHRIAAAKLAWRSDPDALRDAAEALLSVAERAPKAMSEPVDLLSRCYAPEPLDRLIALRTGFESQSADDDVAQLLWLAITAILRECSGVGTAQWQYLLPNKTKARVLDPFDAFRARIAMMADDMTVRQRAASDADATLIAHDARTIGDIRDLDGQVGLVVTSPPYPNNFDYADATRLEMTFWGEVERWGDLHRAVRRNLLCSCAQHASAEKLDLDDVLADPALAPILAELDPVCRALAVARETMAGRKSYHTMVAAYFRDLAMVWTGLRRACAPDSRVCFVVGDSAPYGVHVPVERWLAVLAEAAGFRRPHFEKLRDRNVKWKNRKHRVPLHEGRLWLEG